MEQYLADAEAMMDQEEEEAAAASVNGMPQSQQQRLQNIPIQVQVPTGSTVPANDLFNFERYFNKHKSIRRRCQIHD
jgi:hypothetical protein